MHIRSHCFSVIVACLLTSFFASATLAVEELDQKAVNVYKEFMRAVYYAKTPDQLREYLSDVEIKQIDALKTDREKQAKLKQYKSQYISKVTFYQGERDGDFLKLIGSGYIWRDGKLYPGDVVATMHLEHNQWKIWARAFNNSAGVRSPN